MADPSKLFEVQTEKCG